MKRYFFGACVFLSVFVISSCFGMGKAIYGNGVITTQVRSITSNYRKINSRGSFDIVLISGTENSITIESDENIIPYILTEVKNDILTIEILKHYHIRRSKKLQITVVYENKNIDEISLLGSGDIKSKNVLASDDISLKIYGSGDIDAKVDAKNVFISIKGSGDISVDGKTHMLDADIKGSGDIHTYKLVSEVATFTIYGSGNIETTVHDELTGTIRGSGDIFYRGNPKINADISGSGKLRQTGTS